ERRRGGGVIQAATYADIIQDSATSSAAISGHLRCSQAKTSALVKLKSIISSTLAEECSGISLTVALNTLSFPM
ncbi:MAG: hypothetical protein ACK53Y_08340, partial [bacterium]